MLAIDAGWLKIFDPTADGPIGQYELAERSISLQGKVVILLNNTRDCSNLILDGLVKRLLTQFPHSKYSSFP